MVPIVRGLLLTKKPYQLLVTNNLDSWTEFGVTVSGSAGAYTLTKNDDLGNRQIYSPSMTVPANAIVALRLKVLAGTLTSIGAGVLGGGWGGLGFRVLSGPGAVTGGAPYLVSSLDVTIPTDVVLYSQDANTARDARIYPGGSGTLNSGFTVIVQDISLCVVCSINDTPPFFPVA